MTWGEIPGMHPTCHFHFSWKIHWHYLPYAFHPLTILPHFWIYRLCVLWKWNNYPSILSMNEGWTQSNPGLNYVNIDSNKVLNSSSNILKHVIFITRENC